jgi:hypothetical protein
MAKSTMSAKPMMKMGDMFPVVSPIVGPNGVLPKNVQPRGKPLTGDRVFTPQIGLGLGLDAHH